MKWWTDLKERDAATLSEVRTSLVELDAFLAAFPEQKDAGARRVRLTSTLLGQVQAHLDKHLRGNELDSARNLVSQNQVWLQDEAKTLRSKIDNKQAVLSTLQDAQKRLARKDYEGCLAALQAGRKAFIFDVDMAQQQALSESAHQDLRKRDEAHQKLLTAVEASVKANNAQQVEARLGELANFRAGFPKTDWQPSLDSFRTPVVPDLLAAVWASLHADNVVIGDARRLLAEAKKMRTPPQDPELAALEAVVQAHESTSGDWTRSVADLAKHLQANTGNAIAIQLWNALVPLERQKQSFRFDDLSRLEQTGPNLTLAPIKSANARLLGAVLERLIRKDRWAPLDKEQGVQAAVWCDRIERPTAWIQALKTECLLASAKTPDAVGPWADAGCYGAYVHALAISNLTSPDQSKLMRAVDGLARSLRTDAQALGSVRLRKAAQLIESAVAQLPRVDKEHRAFTTKEDAQKAVAWLTVALELPAVDESADRLIDLTRAAAQAPDIARLELVRGRIESGKLDAPARVDAYYWLAKAYATDKSSASKALAHFDKALELNGTGRVTRRQLATDAMEFAYQLADAEMADQRKNWALAIDYSKRCQRFAGTLKDLDLEAAARINGNAVRLQAVAVYNDKGGHKEKSKNALEYYRVLEEALKDRTTDAFAVPVIVEKLKWAPVRKDHLAANIALGETALGIARKLADDKQPSEFWGKLVSDGLVYLALARHDWLTVQIERNDLSADREEDRQLMLQSYRKILDSLYEVRTRKRHVDKWAGELAFRIGYVHYSASMLLKGTDRKMGQTEAESAYRELNESMKAIQMSTKGVPEAKVPAVVQDARTKIRKALPELESEYNLVPRKSVLTPTAERLWDLVQHPTASRLWA